MDYLPHIALLALILTNQVGKSATHALKNADHTHWARRPIGPGLALTDFYHIMSGVEWLLILYVGWAHWGFDPWWWMALLVTTGIVWPLSKALKGLTWRQAILEAWYMQLILWPTRRWHT